LKLFSELEFIEFNELFEFQNSEIQIIRQIPVQTNVHSVNS